MYTKCYQGDTSALMQAKDAYAIRKILGGRATIYANVTRDEVAVLERSNSLKRDLARLSKVSNFWAPNTCLVVDTLSGRFSSIDEVLASAPKPPQKEEK